MRTHKSLHRLVFRLWLRIFSFPLRIFVQIPKGSKLLVWSALPSTVKWANAHICASPYSCKKIGRGIPARFLRFTNFHRCFYLCKYPQTPSAWGGSGFAWVRPSSRNTGRIWRSTAVIRSASPRGISPCRRASRSNTLYRRVHYLSRCGRGRGAFRLP